MDSVDLLARENEFRKLNKQLEKKTETLINEIENVMQKRDILSEFSKSLTLDIHEELPVKRHNCNSSESNTPSSAKNNNIKYINEKKPQNSTKAQTKTTNLQNDKHKVCSDVKMDCDVSTDCAYHICACSINKKQDTDFEFLQAFVSVNVKDDVLPKSFGKDGAKVENVCKYLSSKVKLMQEQINKLQSTIERKADQCEKHLKTLAEFESERLSLMNRANNMAAVAVDMKAKYMTANNRYNEKDKLYKEQRSLCDKASSEVKWLKSKNAGLDAKCAHHEHHIESLTQQLQAAKSAEKELRNLSRTVSTEHTNAISVLELQTKNLTSKINKQNALIDNLKKQNALLLTDGALKALEGKYCSLLKDFN